jgi:hypothetical protein
LIAAKENGQLLTVPGIGSFKVSWHLAANMKTIKCMFGLQHGANSTYCCIYCLQKRTKSTVSSIAAATAIVRESATSWDGGLFATSVHAKPITGSRALGRWKSVLPISMDRVHICTLHALNRMVEKILHLHFIFIWTIRDKRLQAEAVDDMQKVLSAMGAHGGNVVIFKDAKLSGKSNNIPNKPSLSGANMNNFFG